MSALSHSLKLTVTSGHGSGILSGVTTVQRINTVGGKLEGACDKLGLSQCALLRGLRVPAQELSAFSVMAGTPGTKTRFALLPGVTNFKRTRAHTLNRGANNYGLSVTPHVVTVGPGS